MALTKDMTFAGKDGLLFTIEKGTSGLVLTNNMAWNMKPGLVKAAYWERKKRPHPVDGMWVSLKGQYRFIEREFLKQIL